MDTCGGGNELKSDNDLYGYVLKSYLHFCRYQYLSGQEPFRSHVKWIFNDFFLRFILQGAPYFSDFPAVCVEPLSPFRNLTASLYWKTSQTRSPALPTHSCMQMHTRSHEYPCAHTQPFTHQLCYCLPLSHNPADPLWQSSQSLRDNINSNSPLSSPFICFLFLPALSASLSFIPVAPFPFCHYPTQRPKKIPRISIHTPKRSTNLQCTFSRATVVLPLTQMLTHRYKQRSVSV